MTISFQTVVLMGFKCAICNIKAQITVKFRCIGQIVLCIACTELISRLNCAMEV